MLQHFKGSKEAHGCHFPARGMALFWSREALTIVAETFKNMFHLPKENSCPSPLHFHLENFKTRHQKNMHYIGIQYSTFLTIYIDVKYLFEVSVRAYGNSLTRSLKLCIHNLHFRDPKRLLLLHFQNLAGHSNYPPKNYTVHNGFLALYNQFWSMIFKCQKKQP